MADFHLTQDQIAKFTELGIMDDVNKLLDQKGQSTTKEWKDKLAAAEEARKLAEQQSIIQKRSAELASVPEKNRELVSVLLEKGKSLDDIKSSHPELLAPFKPINEVLTGSPGSLSAEEKAALERANVIELIKKGTGKSEELTLIASAIQADPTILDEAI